MISKNIVAMVSYFNILKYNLLNLTIKFKDYNQKKNCSYNPFLTIIILITSLKQIQLKLNMLLMFYI